MRKVVRLLVLSLLTVALAAPAAQAQYFGRNKVQWEQFDFKVIQTEHFDIYYYEQEADVVRDIGRMAERWYTRLSRVFNHSFNRKPIVLYANAADFQQTTTTGGMLPQGTGGFTDEFMNRVVMPLTGDYAENDHVLGHELVHVFQYDIAAAHTNARRRFSLNQMPLWVIEGMAEYFSKGRIDPLTSMWVRDATIHDRLPDLRKLTRDPRYFPYRYGQAILAYIGGRFGDEAVVRYFVAAGLVGVEPAFERVLGLNAKQVFTDWQESARELYNPIVTTRSTDLGTPIIGQRPVKGKRSRGELNIGPAISPDGRYVAFLSTRELFDIDLFLADARTGEVVRKLVSTDRDAHLDAIRFIDSAGSWSPDSRKLAFVSFSRGDNFLGIVDVESRDIDNIRVPGLEAMSNVARSPDGRTIAISGQTTGVSDLYLYDLESKQVRRLTNDKFADLQPVWSADGRTIAFVSDRGAGTELEQLRFNEMRISVADVSSGQVSTLRLFDNAKHINPQFGPNNTLYFIANPEGIPDIYRYSFADQRIERVTSVQTGVAGITDMSPAMSVALRTGDITLSLFEDDNYNIYRLGANAPVTAVTETAAADAPRAAVLPPFRATGSLITAYLNQPAEGLPAESVAFRERPYDPALHIAYIGPPSLGVGVDRFGAGVGGSVAAFWSDILGQHNVGFTFAGGGGGTGSITDQIGGEVFYLNQKRRFNWGADLSHVPYVAAQAGFARDFVNVDGQLVLADIYQEFREIQTITDLSGIAQYPFSTTRRLEWQAGVQRYSYKLEVQTLIVVGGQVIDEETERLPGSFTVNLGKGAMAFVGDSSVWAFISPVRGTRYRYEVQALTGDLKFQTGLADWRKYFFMRPTTLAVRGLYYGRFGQDAESGVLSDLYLGNYGLVRGYEGISPDECIGGVPTVEGCPQYRRLLGSKIGMGSVELRAPLLGTKEYGLINAPSLPTEIYAFGDVGVAWRNDEDVNFSFDTDTLERVPVFSAGVGIRLLLSYIPLEFYVAKPFQRPTENIVYGFNIAPGW